VSQDVVPFVLPGPAADRETAAGWAIWRQRRRGFVAASRLSAGQYAALSPRRRSLYDLHRSATHANLAFQETPMGVAVSRLLWSRLQGNALKHGPATRAGVMVTGGGYQGKTETVCEVAAAFEDQWLELNHQVNPHAAAGTRDLWATVVYVQTPVTATPKSVCEAILNFYGALHPRKTLAQLVADVRTSLYEHGTKVLIIDDVSRLRLHREADRDALDLLRSLMSMHVTLVLIGVEVPYPGLAASTGAFTGSVDGTDPAATQTQRRFDVVGLGPFRYDTPTDIAAWVAHLAGLEDQVRLLRGQPGMLTGGVMPEYLFGRTAGVIGLLERLIEDGCGHAMDTGAELLTTDVLDEVDITLAAVGRVPAAGEVPPIPTHGRKPRRSGRNTVFDDRGHDDAKTAGRR
jgi:hypothetical protein